MGGTQRSAGAAYGIPTSLFTTEYACGREVAIPMTTPESIVTVGPVMPRKDTWSANYIPSPSGHNMTAYLGKGIIPRVVTFISRILLWTERWPIR